MGGGKGGKVTTGYWYSMGLHFGICHGPVDYLSEIRVGGRTAYNVTVTSNQEIYINESKLFGGKSREGGIQGYADILNGGPGQAVNEYLQEQHPDDLVPAYRGLFSLVYKGGRVSANNPYIKPWAFKVGRIKAGWGGQQATSETEYSNYVLYPWESGDRDPRNCKNDHEYQREGTGSPAWRSTLEEAIADAEAFIGHSLDTTLLGWSKGTSDFNRQTISPYADVDPGEEEILHLHFNEHSAGVVDFYGDLPEATTQCVAFHNAGFVPGVTPKFFWTGLSDDGSSITVASGIYLLSDRTSGTDFNPSPLANSDNGNNCINYSHGGDGFFPFSSGQYDTLIRVRRKIRAPDDPCDPRCEDPYPDYPPDSSYCLIDSTAVKRGPWGLTSGTYKALAVYKSEGIGDTIQVTQYPLGPVLPSSDPNYDSHEYWVAQRNAAILAGYDVPATYDAEGNGGDGTYPRLIEAAYTRTGGTIAENAPWNPDYAQIDADMNPAHIVYQCITNAEWGMGYPEASIGDTFTTVAQALYDEEFGLSFQWTQQQPIEEFIAEVMNHAGGVWYADPRTGLFELALIRDDYSVSDLRVFDETNILAVESYQRPGYGELTNQIVVSWTDVQNNKTATTAPLQDAACIQAQGSVIGEVKQYPGITKSGLAQRVALRDLTAASTPLATLRLKVNREAWDLVPGRDVIVVSWDKLGIDQLVCRVIKVDRGTLNDGAITLEVAEDVFGLPDAVYTTQEEGGWVGPDTAPEDITIQDLVESPYWDVARNLSTADLDYTDVDAGYVFTVAARSNSTDLGYDIWSRTGSTAYEEKAQGPFAPTALLDGAIDQQATSLTIDNGIDLDLVAVGGRVLIGSGRLAEFCEVLSLDVTSGAMTVSRAVLDTTPQEHADNTRLWFVEDAFGAEPTERATSDEVDVKLTAIATGGESDVDDATEQTIVLDGRFGRPYPPGRILINGQSFPPSIDTTEDASEGFVITWTHRDRTQQDVELVSQSEGNIGPEAGTTYTVELYNDGSDTLVESTSGIAGTSLSITATDSFLARLEIYSVRDGIESWQRQVRRFVLIGTDVFVTEDGDTFITEDGQILAPE